MGTSPVTADDVETIAKVYIAFSTIFVAVFFCCRVNFPASRIHADWCIYLAWTNYITLCGCALAASSDGLRSLGFLSTQDTGSVLFISSPIETAISIFASLSLGFTRLAALLEHRHISLRRYTVDKSAISRIYCTVLAVATGIWALAMIVLPILQCGNKLEVWASELYGSAGGSNGQCVGYNLSVAFTISNLVLGLLTVAVTIHTLATLQPWRVVCKCLCLGYLPAWASLGAAVARIAVLMSATPGTESEANHYISMGTIGMSLTFISLFEAGFAVVGITWPTLALWVDALYDSGKVKKRPDFYDIWHLRRVEYDSEDVECGLDENSKLDKTQTTHPEGEVDRSAKSNISVQEKLAQEMTNSSSDPLPPEWAQAAIDGELKIEQWLQKNLPQMRSQKETEEENHLEKQGPSQKIADAELEDWLKKNPPKIHSPGYGTINARQGKSN